jgi:hypothetical protein
MVELGFDPSDPQDVIKYDKFMNDLSENLDKMEDYLKCFDEPTELENDVEFEADFNLEEDEEQNE